MAVSLSTSSSSVHNPIASKNLGDTQRLKSKDRIFREIWRAIKDESQSRRSVE